MQDAQANGLVASLKHQAEVKMGILHAVYGEFPSRFIRSFITLGLGAFTSPLVATQLTQLRHWSFHYIVSLGNATCNTFVIFRTKTLDGGLIYLFPLIHASLLSCSGMFTSYWSRNSREGGRREYLTRSFVSKLSIFSHTLSLFMLV